MEKQKFKKPVFWGGILFLTLMASPLVGVYLSGRSVSNYVHFPPITTEAEPHSFSWIVFSAILLFVILTTWPFWKRIGKGGLWLRADLNNNKFPWWGWLAVAGSIGFWILAWSRFPWFEPIQRLTFFPLWLCFVLLLNALAQKVTGKSPITQNPVFFLLLFPASAAFWWIFEYLNRFVNNWYYLGVSKLGGWQYFWEATLPFSTVLPAVISMLYLVLQFPAFKKGYTDFPSNPWLTSRRFWIILGLLSIVGLIGTGWMPKFTFPLLWIAPGILWVSFQAVRGYVNPMLKKASKGDLTLVWASAISALLCGFFWEMWNLYSAAKWQYNVPGIERFHLFEMPALGYAGYLPFGVICLLVSYSIFSTWAPNKWMLEEDVI